MKLIEEKRSGSNQLTSANHFCERQDIASARKKHTPDKGREANHTRSQTTIKKQIKAQSVSHQGIGRTADLRLQPSSRPGNRTQRSEGEGSILNVQHQFHEIK